ncbi:MULTISPECIES: GntR family transcriptional regulator [unclassified Streptomyces]|uniref:GntR family transcriptional regulator n=1 Tax=unclassified Streptomyces TaxID=2593676 RepID=UPI00099D93CA|nr:MULTISPECIES: GntR family transcriptional regulator [unclassified Streptomyces]
MPELDRTPPYLQVVQELRRRIVDGELADGDRLPSVRQIAEEWQIAQATAMKALAALRADGLAESVVGVGTVVRSRYLHRSAADRLDRALRTGKIYPEGEHAVIKSATLAVPPAWVADLLGLDEGTQAIRRHRVTHNEDGPVSASISWFSPDLAESVPALLVADRIPGGTPNAIEAGTGRRAVNNTEEASGAFRANAEQAEDLGISVGDPVHVGRNVYSDTNGEILEIGESVAPEGRWKVHRTI